MEYKIPQILQMILFFLFSKLHIIPFLYMFSDLTNTVLNVLLFLPLGFFLPIFWTEFIPFPWAVLFGFFTSLLIESLQIFTRRATDINDLITNTAGTFLGWIIARVILRLFPGQIIPGHRVWEVYIVSAAAFAVMFFLQPFLADFLFSFFRIFI